MAFEHDADPSAQYDDLRRRFVELVAQSTPQQQTTIVPATPAWTVLDALAHVVGIAADLNAGRFGSDLPGDEWTATQVRSREGRSVADLAGEWDREARQFTDGLALFGYSMGAHFVGDLLHHFADVTHALGRPAPANDPTLLVALDFYLESFDEALRSADLGRVIVHAGVERHECGAGAVRAEVGATPYEVFRALGGRRSLAQLRSFDWTGDRDSVLPSVSRYGLPATDLVERVD